MDQLDLIPDERDEIPTSVNLDMETLRRWAGDEAGGWEQLPEILDVLALLKGKHGRKKRSTILALARAQIDGTPEENLWTLETTCARTTYHGRWKKNKQFTRIRDYVIDVAIKYHSSRQVRDILSARDEIRNKALGAAIRLAREVDNHDPKVALAAITKILDITQIANPEITDGQLAAGLDPSIKGTETVRADDDDSVTLEEWLAGEEDRRRQVEAAEDMVAAFEADDLIDQALDDDDATDQ